MFRGILQLLRCDDGPTSVEYAVMLALVVLSAWLGMTAFGNQAVGTWQAVGQSLSGTPFGS